MQIVAMEPEHLSVASIPKEKLEEQREIIEANLEEKNKGNQRAIEGKLKKWFKETCLLEQEFVIVDYESDSAKKTVGLVVKELGEKLNIPLEIKEIKLYK